MVHMALFQMIKHASVNAWVYLADLTVSEANTVSHRRTVSNPEESPSVRMLWDTRGQQNPAEPPRDAAIPWFITLQPQPCFMDKDTLLLQYI